MPTKADEDMWNRMQGYSDMVAQKNKAEADLIAARQRIEELEAEVARLRKRIRYLPPEYEPKEAKLIMPSTFDRWCREEDEALGKEQDGRT